LPDTQRLVVVAHRPPAPRRSDSQEERRRSRESRVSQETKGIGGDGGVVAALPAARSSPARLGSL
jgi:hypothetical protein